MKTAMNRLKNKLPWPSRQRQSCSVCTSLDFKWGDELEWWTQFYIQLVYKATLSFTLEILSGSLF